MTVKVATRRAAPELHTEEVYGLQRGDGLSREWHALLDRAPPEQRIYGPDWFRIWNETEGSAGRWQGRLQLVTARDAEGRLHGVLPLGLVRMGVVTARASAGPWQLERTLVVAAGMEQPVGEALAAHVANSGWPLVRIGPCVGTARQVRPFLEALRAHGVYVHVQRKEPMTIIEPPPGVAQYRKEVLGKSFARSLLYYERRLAKDGDVRVAHFRECSHERAARLIEHLATIERGSWLRKAEPEKPRFLDPDTATMWQRLVVETFSPQGTFDCFVLYLDERPIAYGLCLTVVPVRYYVFTGYDLEFRKRSVGSIIYRYVMEEGIERGVQRFEFGSQHMYYKKRWGAQVHASLDTLLVFPNRLVRGLARLAHPLLRAREPGDEWIREETALAKDAD